MTEYLETLNRAERGALRRDLESMYNAIVDEEAAAWHDRKVDPVAYAETIGKLSVIQAVFNKLGIDFEYGRRIDK